MVPTGTSHTVDLPIFPLLTGSFSAVWVERWWMLCQLSAGRARDQLLNKGKRPRARSLERSRTRSISDFAIVRTHAETPARATGITQVGGRLAGAVGPLVVGLIAENLSYTAAWAVDGSVVVASAAVMLVGRQLLSRRLAEAAAAPG